MIWGHRFKKTPNPFRKCTACHGSRIGAEFKGENSGIAADVHFKKGNNCSLCHGANELHGAAGEHRYEIDQRGKLCKGCHDQVGAPADPVTMHGATSSRVRSATPSPIRTATNATVGPGVQKPSQFDFRIGRNPRQGQRYPQTYVVLRHVPVVPQTYAAYDATLTLPG